MTTKWRISEDVLDDAAVYDTLPDALKAQGWELRSDGLWWAPEADMGATEAKAAEWEEIYPVRQYNIGTSGTVRVEYQATVWARDYDQAVEAAAELPDILSGSQFEMTEPPDADDFEGWAKEVVEAQS